MKSHLVEGLICPQSGKPLVVKNAIYDQETIQSGSLSTEDGRFSYPIESGVAYLAVIDQAWASILKELTGRREIIAQNLKNPEPKKVNEKKTQQDAGAQLLADDCFEQTVQHLPGHRPLRLLDCGAGMFETSSWFAEQGIDVVATETEISMARYANFEDIGRGDPQPFSINGKDYFIRDPQGFKKYFSRVVCDIQRLPFADDYFDVSFCRAMLHHVDRPREAVSEMLRVTKMGGRVLLCAEPARGILDKEEAIHEDTVDRQVGMNEQAPTLNDYLAPLRSSAKNVQVQYWPFPLDEDSTFLKRMLQKVVYRKLHPGQTVKGWKQAKLFPVSVAVNIYGERSETKIEPPLSPDENCTIKIDEILEIYVKYDQEKTIADLERGTRELRGIRRKILSQEPGKFPSSINIGKASTLLLDNGWSIINTINGRPCREVVGKADVVLQRKTNGEQLIVRYYSECDSNSKHAAVLINGRECGILRGSGKRWVKKRFRIPQDNLPILHLEIIPRFAPENENDWPPFHISHIIQK